MLAQTNSEEALKNIQNDCFTGFNNILISLIKPVTEYITAPLIHTINTQISKKKHL